MEIRHAPLPLYSPLQPVQPPARTPAPQEAGATTGLPPERRGALTEYIARGELVEENDNNDYGELIRTARQQRGDSTQEAPAATGNGASSYATRALSAYQANTGAAATGTHAGLDEIV